MEIGTQVKVNEDSSYSHLNKFTLVVDRVQHGLMYPIAVRIAHTDSFEWFREDELQVV